MTSLLNPHPASGVCTVCGVTHSLPVGNSRRYAFELMAQLEDFERIDFLAESTPPMEPVNPTFSTRYLWGEARGQMFGVLECEDDHKNTVILRAFSSQYHGEWLVEGWVPPVIDVEAFHTLIEPTDQEINRLTHALQKLSPSDPDYAPFFEKRKRLSQTLMKEIHSLYTLTNFKGEQKLLADVFPTSGGIPNGVGDCCAPKLLNHAALHHLTPIGLSEFYWGKESKSGARQHKTFYPACTEKCQPILGFMLCGIEKISRPLVSRSSRHVAKNEPLSERCASAPLQEKEPFLNILHQDTDLIIVNKPSGLLSVPGRGPENQDCVTERIKQLYPECPDQPAVHRLDMDTSGIMVIARTAEAHRELSRQFHDREIKKRYIALLDGILEANQGVIELPFRLDIDNRPHQIYDPVHGKIGLTHWKKIEVKDGKTRIAFFPVTGRTHQLRVHSAAEQGLGIPILGDRLYGTGTAPGQLKLHANFLSFAHPRTGKTMKFHSKPLF